MGSRKLYNSITVTMTKNSVIHVKIILNDLKKLAEKSWMPKC